MTHAATSFVHTISDRCRVCYTCVRECPAKAIRIDDGQAQVVPERCIACGNCVKVCSQDAKQFVRTTDQVTALLQSDRPLVACVAPSFPAEFTNGSPEQLVGALRQLGFGQVVEVSFGADLVAAAYKQLLADHPDERFVATTCPAVVNFVERYHPELVGRLAPIVSPMVAVARALRKLHGARTAVVFVGPCIAKKTEAVHRGIEGDVDEAITFVELQEMFDRAGISIEESPAVPFDEPAGGLGALFPVARGMLQAAALDEDLLGDEIVTADGLLEFVPAIEEFAGGHMNARLLEVLSCSGCIMGPGMNSDAPRYERRSRVSAYVRQRVSSLDKAIHQEQLDRFGRMNLARTYETRDQRIPAPGGDGVDEILARLGKIDPSDELNCGACGYATCRQHAVAIHKGLAEDEMCLPHVIDRLKQTVSELSLSHRQLADTQDALMQSEKLASMGQLAAGVAHELNNPLGVVLMYGHLLLDELDGDSQMASDLKMIVEQAERSKRIVADLLDFARQNKVLFEEVSLSQIVHKAVNGVVVPEGITVSMAFDHTDDMVEMDPDQMHQVFTNLIRNGIDAMTAGTGEVFGTLTISTSDSPTEVVVAIEDTGEGIAKDVIKKIFQPFFTTKKLGKGTGLGLAVSYGVVKMHRGAILVTSNNDPEKGPTGSRFEVTIPRHSAR